MMPAFAVALSTLVAWGDDISVDTRVSGVTVYLDRARVVREVSVDVPAGRSDLVFAGLPIGLVAESLAAEGEGTANAILTGIDIRAQRGVEDRDSEVAALRAERTRREDAVREQSDVIQRVQADLVFVASIRPVAPGKLEDRLFLAPDAGAQMAAVAKLVGAETQALLKEQRAAEQRIRDEQREIGRIDRELQALAAPGNEDSMRVAVGLDAGRSGRVTVRLAYVVGGASWAPHYDARYRPSDGKVVLDVSGEVRQQTGEDWTDVRLLLSTARSQDGTSPPALEPFYLQEGYYGGPATAVVGEGAAVEFAAKTRETVTADGTNRRVFLESLTLDGEVIHQVVPRRIEAAWLTARVKNTAAFTLPAGGVSAYMGTAYVGEGSLASTASGVEFDLSFGVDDRVRVTRTRLKTLAIEAKALGNRDKAAYGWKTTVTNRSGRAIELRVSDQVPVARETIWQVDTTLSPPLDVPSSGVFTWSQVLAEGKSQDFVVEYLVSWPQGDPPVLME